MTTASPSVQDTDVTFADFDVRPEIVEALAEAGIIKPFPIQAMTLPVALQGHDIIGQAKTGTGKTLGFGVPLLSRVVAPGEEGYDQLPAPGKPQALVIVPTRELAVQVAKDFEVASVKRSVRIVQLYGGRAYEPQVEALKNGVDVVVGTPGRIMDMLKQKHLTLSRAATVVLDEADEMLDLGFLPDVEKILAQTPAVRNTMLFSATMPGAVVTMARRYMSQPTHIRANDPEDAGATHKNIKQVIYRAHALDKTEMLSRILQARGRGLTIVFTRTKRTAAKVAEELTERGFAAGALHGDLGQGAREQALRAFRNGKVDILVATDVAARGIDVDNVTHVVNFQVPEDEKTYLHRTGRTGRAGNQGTAVTFVDWDDIPHWALINKALELNVPEPLETYSSSPHLFTDLDIPEGTKGRLPKDKRTREGLDAEVLEDLGETGKRTPRSGDRGNARGSRDGGQRNSRASGGNRDSRQGKPDSKPSADAQGPGEAKESAPRGDRASRQRNRTRRVNGEVQDAANATTTAPAQSAENSADSSESPKAPSGNRNRSRNRRRTNKADAPSAE